MYIYISAARREGTAGVRVKKESKGIFKESVRTRACMDEKHRWHFVVLRLCSYTPIQNYPVYIRERKLLESRKRVQSVYIAVASAAYKRKRGGEAGDELLWSATRFLILRVYIYLYILYNAKQYLQRRQKLFNYLWAPMSGEKRKN